MAGDCFKSIELVTNAPEVEGSLEVIRYLSNHGVIASIGHSDATYEEVVEAIQAGASHVTHLYNGMRGLHHREPGVVGAALLHDELMVELISDGIHVRPELVKLTFQQKGREKVLLITDAMRAKCLGEGLYDLGGQMVTVQNGKATLHDGAPGSITQDDGGSEKYNEVYRVFITRCPLYDFCQSSKAVKYF